MIAKIKKNKRDYSNNNIFALVFLCFFVLMIVFLLVKANLGSKERRAELLAQKQALEMEMEALEEMKKRLEAETLSIEDDEYLEKIAREQFGLKKPGEEVVYIIKEEDEENDIQEEKKEKKEWWQKIIDVWPF